MTVFLIALITLFNGILHYFKLGAIPDFPHSFLLTGLMISSAISVFSSFLVYLIAKLHFQNTRISLLSFFVFSVFPWVFELGRNGSYPTVMLFLILILVFFLSFPDKMHKSRVAGNLAVPVLFIIGVSGILFLLKKPEWVFSYAPRSYTFTGVFSNIYHLISPDFLFFRNDSFWNGGNKDWGILLLSFAPFLFMGIIDVFRKKSFVMSLWFVTGLSLAVLNPHFPESFEFYIVVPILVLAVARGLYFFCSRKKWMISLFVLFFVFEYAVYLHTYLVHYPQNTRDYFQNISKPI